MPVRSQTQKVLCSILLLALSYQGPSILADQNESNAFAIYKKLSLETSKADHASKLTTLWNTAQKDEYTSISQHSLIQANTNFSYLGLPINPLLLKEFMPWHSDSQPSIMSIDIGTSQFANRYYSAPPVFNEAGYVATNDHSDNSTFSYKWLGRLSNGIHALKTIDDTAGTAVFIGLTFVSFELNELSIPSGHTQLLMVNKGIHGIGDRIQSKISIQHENNKVILETIQWNGTDKISEKVILDLNEKTKHSEPASRRQSHPLIRADKIAPLCSLPSSKTIVRADKRHL